MEDLTIEKVRTFLQINSFEKFPSQNKLCFPILNRIYKKMRIGVEFTGIKIEVNDKIILDGHHRYIASKLAQIDLDVFPYPKNTDTFSYKWNTIKVVEEDWDTIEKIIYLNELDANYNNIDVKVLNRLIL